jgi:hypothetical protein
MRILKLVFINVLVLVVLVCLLESVMDYLSFHREGKGEAKEELVYVRRMLPVNFDGVVEPHDFQKSVDATLRRSFRLVTNRDGLILGPSQYAQRDSLSVCDILFMGGSTTECKFVDDSLRFPYRVAKPLSEALGRRVVTLNAGMSGNNTFHSIVNLVNIGLSYKPKVVVLMHNINDLAVLCRTGSYFNAPGTHRSLVKRIVTERRSFAEHFVSTHFSNLTAAFRETFRRQTDRSGAKPSKPDEFSGYRSMHVDEKLILREFSKALATFHGI